MISQTFGSYEEYLVLKKVKNNDFTTTDSHHSYMNGLGEMVYQWAILDSMSHMIVVFETTDRQQYEIEKEKALKFLRENGGWE